MQQLLGESEQSLALQRVKNFIIVNTMNLVKTFHHQSCLIDVNIFILICLLIENPFAVNMSHTIDWIN
jgi:hypothetical protein